MSLAAALLLAASPAHAGPGPPSVPSWRGGEGARWYVDDDAVGFGSGTAADPFISVSFAVSRPEVEDGDVVVVLPGDYPNESIRIDGRSLSIVSTGGPDETTLYGAAWPPAGTAPVLFVRGVGAQVEVRGFRITGGTGSLEASGFVEPVGGAVAVIGGAHLLLADCEFEGNSSARGGDVYARDASLSLESSSFLGPGCDARGEAIYTRDAALSADDCTFEDLRTGPPGVPSGGGAVLIEHSTATLSACTFERNGSALFGAHVWSRNSSLALESCTLRAGVAYAGGAVAVIGGDLAMTDGLVEDNAAIASPGGGLFASGAGVHLERVAFLRNRIVGAREGGAVALLVSDLVAEDSLFAENVAHHGGALDVGVGASAWVTGCRFARNRAESDGGATSGPLRARRSHFTGNVTGGAGGAPATGAALSGDGVLERCTIAGNVGGEAAVRGRWLVSGTIAWGNGPVDVITHATVARSIVGTLVAPEGAVTSTTSEDPRLWSPGHTELLPGSPAIDALPPEEGLDPDGSAPELGADAYAVLDHPPGYAADLGEVACEGALNSTGGAASLTLVGATSRARDRLVLAGAGFPPSVPAVVLASRTAGTTPLPLSSGPLCIAAPIVRVTPNALFTRLDGTLAARVPIARPPFSGGPGSTWTFQAWFRDAAGTAATGISAARTVTLVP